MSRQQRHSVVESAICYSCYKLLCSLGSPTACTSSTLLGVIIPGSLCIQHLRSGSDSLCSRKIAPRYNNKYITKSSTPPPLPRHPHSLGREGHWLGWALKLMYKIVIIIIIIIIVGALKIFTFWGQNGTRFPHCQFRAQKRLDFQDPHPFKWLL
jgi:hypothetical protein